MDRGSIQCREARIGPVTTDVDLIDILGTPHNADITHVRTGTAIWTAGHTYTERHVRQAERMKIDLYLSHYLWEGTLSFGKCQSTGWECRAGHGKAIGPCCFRVGGDAVFVQ